MKNEIQKLKIEKDENIDNIEEWWNKHEVRVYGWKNGNKKYGKRKEEDQLEKEHLQQRYAKSRWLEDWTSTNIWTKEPNNLEKIQWRQKFPKSIISKFEGTNMD